MGEDLYLILDGLMAYVGRAAEYLAAHQRVLNLVLVVSIFCLALIAISAYVRTRADDSRPYRGPERRAGNGQRPSEPRFAGHENERGPVLPVMPGPLAPSPPASPLNESGHRLSRLEESFLRLNRDVMALDETVKDLRHEIETLSLGLSEMRQDRRVALQSAPSAPIEPIVGTALEVVSPPESGNSVIEYGNYEEITRDLSETAKKVDELSATVESQRRTLLAIGQVLAQLPDWRKFKTSVVESLEDVVSAVESKARRSG